MMITMVECHQSFFIRRSENENRAVEQYINCAKCKQKEACASPRVRLSIFDVVNQLDAEQILVLDDVVDAFDISLVG